MPDSDIRDVLILGAGPAGAAAALWSGTGLDVEILERTKKSAPGVQLEWLNQAARAALGDAGIPRGEAVAATIDRVRFVEPNLSKSTVAMLDEPVELVHVERLTEAMLSAARDSGAVFNQPAAVSRIEVREDLVALHTEDGGSSLGRFLIFAGGTDAFRMVPGFVGATAERSESSICEWRSCADPPRLATKADPGIELTIILDSRDPGTYGYAYVLHKLQVIGFVSHVEDEGHIRSEFDRNFSRWKAGGLFAEARFSIEQTVVRSVPRGAALETESHVSKRCILIGDAGGFVAALSHDGLHAAIQSARIAVDTCRTALTSEQPQDALAEFDHKWRHDLVEFLRLPNADLRFLVPLVFTNELMAKKLASAFIAGTNL
ncbi:MAG: hypothetical protein O7B26_11050 [Planctomycetota bacterium]|nr:hypothetical protein [Planctomycetota bacterium]